MVQNKIIQISAIKCNLLSSLVRVNDSEATIPDSVSFTDLCDIQLPASLVIQDKDDDGCRLYTSQITFLVPSLWFFEFRRMAFLCTTVDGLRILIGNADRPYPTITQTQNHPKGASDSELTEVVVKWISPDLPPFLS